MYVLYVYTQCIQTMSWRLIHAYSIQHVYTYIRTYVRPYVYISINIYTCIYIYMYMSIYMCVYICIHRKRHDMYTHLHYAG